MKSFLVQGKSITWPTNSKNKNKKLNRETKITSSRLGAKTRKEYAQLNCAHAQNQICQTTSEMEGKFSFLAAEEVLDVGTGI